MAGFYHFFSLCCTIDSVMAELLRLDSLSLDIEGKKIFSDISFSIERGDFAVLCGRNGAGKSQLLRVIKGLRKQSEGKIYIEGSEIKKADRLKKIALVFQNADLQFVGDTVEKDIAFGPENLGWKKDKVKEAVEKALSLMKLEALRKQKVHSLSGGEKRKLAIAGVLAMEPEILLLDEPFSALDYPSTKLVLSALVELNAKGHTLIIVSHEIEKFLSHTSKVLIMKEGQLIHSGSPSSSLEALREAEVYVPHLPLEEFSWLKD